VPRLFDYVFLVYPGTDKDLDGYAPRWLAKKSVYRSKLSLAGIITKPKGGVIGRGLILVIPNTVRNMLAISSDCVSLKENLQKMAEKLSLKAVAIAGRAPSIFLHHGIELDELFVQGTKGMVFCTIKTVEDVFQKHSLSVEDTKICIFGSGRVGTTIADYLKSYSYNVSLTTANSIFDEKEADTSVADISLKNADVVIVISAKGSDIYPYMKHLKDGAIIIDDTHPRMLRPFKRGFVYRASLGIDGLKFTPSLPSYNSDSIPGCVIEAIVQSSSGKIETQQEFNEKATAIGFRTRNIL